MSGIEDSKGTTPNAQQLARVAGSLPTLTPGNIQAPSSGVNNSGSPAVPPASPVLVPQQSQAEQINATRPKGTSPVAFNPSRGTFTPSPIITAEQQSKAEAIQQAKVEGTYQTPGGVENTPMKAIQKANDLLGITYISGGGGAREGGPTARDIYVGTILSEYEHGYIAGPSKDRGNPPEQRLADLLGQVQLSYNPQTKTITDPLMESLSSLGFINTEAGGHPGGYAGISGGGSSSLGGLGLFTTSSVSPKGDTTKAYGGLAQFLPNPNVTTQKNGVEVSGLLDTLTKGTTKPVAQQVENNYTNIIPNTSPESQAKVSLSKAQSVFGKDLTSFGQKDLLTQGANNILVKFNNDVIAISPEQYITQYGAVKSNQEYGGNTNFLVSNIGTENSIGPTSALYPKGTKNTPPVEHADLSSLGTTPLVNVGGHGVLASLLYVPSKEEVASANKAREEYNNPIALGNGLISLSNKQIAQKNNEIALGNGLISLSNEQNKPKYSTIGAGLEFTFAEPIFNERLSPNWKFSGNLASESSFPGNVERPIQYAISNIPLAIVGTYGLIESIPNLMLSEMKYYQTVGASLLKGQIPKPQKNFPEIYSPEAKQLVEQVSSTMPVPPSLVSGAIVTAANVAKGKPFSLEAFGTGESLASTAAGLGGDVLVTFAGAEGIIPLKINRAVIEQGAGLTKDMHLYTALTVGFSEGGSSRIVVGKAPGGPIQFGTPKPETYMPENFPINPTGRGLTVAEGSQLLNHLLNRNEALDWLESRNILTKYDIMTTKAVRDAMPYVTNPNAPIIQYHSTFGENPLANLTPIENKALKDIIIKSQSTLGTGPQYGSYGERPFVPGNVATKDLDIAVKDTTQQTDVGKLAELALNKATQGPSFDLLTATKSSEVSTLDASITNPNTPSELVFNNQVFGVNQMKGFEGQRSFEFIGSPEKNRGVFLNINGEREAKIIDLPIKGENEEGGALSENTYHRVFGKKEPTKTYNIEGIETLTPAYNTARRATTITRIGSTKMSSALTGQGLTTRYGNYVGAEAGRFEKDTARSYRGYILQAQAYRARGLPGDIKAAKVLEQSAKTLKQRWQHKINFKQALYEIHGEEYVPFVKSPEKTTPTYTSQILSGTGKQSLLLLHKEPSSNIKESGTSSSNKKQRQSISNYDSTKSLSNLSSIKPTEELSSLPASSTLKDFERSPTKSMVSKSRTSRASQRPSISSRSLASESSPSKSILPSNVSITPSPSSPSKSPGSPSSFLTTKPSLMPNNPLTTENTGLTKPTVAETFNEKPPTLLFDTNMATKTTEGIPVPPGDRANFLGNTSESQITGIYNRKEITYGLKATEKLAMKDYNRVKNRKGFETTKSHNIKVTDLGLDRLQRVNKFENNKFNYKEKTKRVGKQVTKKTKGLGF